MKGSRISIAGAMLAVVAVALGLAALARPSEMAANAAFTAALASLGAATLGAIYSRGARRAGWNGYLSFAGVYLAISIGPWLADPFGPRLLTSTGINALYERMSYVPVLNGESIWIRRGTDEYVLGRFSGDSTAVPPSLIVDPRNGTGSFYTTASQLRSLSPEAMRQLGHSLCAFIVGGIGAALARWFAAREQRAAIGVDRPIDGAL